MFELNQNIKTKLKSEDIKDLLHKILTYIKTITNSDAGTIYLKDCNNNLEFSIFQNDSLSENTSLDLELILKNIKLPIEENSQILSVESFITSDTNSGKIFVINICIITINNSTLFCSRVELSFFPI